MRGRGREKERKKEKGHVQVTETEIKVIQAKEIQGIDDHHQKWEEVRIDSPLQVLKVVCFSKFMHFFYIVQLIGI